MNNNDIFKKLRVALQLRDEQIIEIMELVDFRMSVAELSAFFRKQEHPNYMECGDQVLRNFLNGLVIHLRGTKENPKNPTEVLRQNMAQLKSPAKGFDPKENSKKPFVKSPAKSTAAKSTTAKPRNKSPKRVESKPQVVEKVKFNNGKGKKG